MRTRGFEPPTTAFSTLRVYPFAPRPPTWAQPGNTGILACLVASGHLVKEKARLTRRQARIPALPGCAPRSMHRARLELAASGFGDLRSYFQLSYRCRTNFQITRCRRQESNLQLLSSELSASAKLRHVGTLILSREPGTRTLMSVTPVVFKTTALPIGLALCN